MLINLILIKNFNTWWTVDESSKFENFVECLWNKVSNKVHQLQVIISEVV